LTDRLLMTRSEQLREFALKVAACLSPTAVLVGVLFALGGTAPAILTLVFGGLAGVALATSMRSIRGAIAAGLLLALGLVLLLLFFAYVREA
jgi:hypothetical protein